MNILQSAQQLRHGTVAYTIEEEKTMKKLFACCPTEGRTNEDVIKSVEKIHQYAELVTGEELQILPLSDVANNKSVSGNNEILNVVFANLMFLKKADYFIFPEILHEFDNEFAEITRIELHAAQASGLKLIAIPDIAKNTFFPDLINDIPVNDRKCCCNTPSDDPLRPIHLKPDTNSAELSDGEKI